MTDEPHCTADWMTPLAELFEQLQSSEQGLTQKNAESRLAGSQRLRARKRSSWKLLLDQFKNPIILLLACSAVLSFTLPGEQANAWIIVSILMASGLLSFWQELSAADAVAKLMRMIETKATVIRDGREREVPLDKIVSGDVLRLRAGDLIPGDCRIMTARDTEFGRISERLQHKAPETGFERGLRQFGQLLVKVVLVITAVVFAIKVGWQGKPIAESLLVGLALLHCCFHLNHSWHLKYYWSTCWLIFLPWPWPVIAWIQNRLNVRSDGTCVSFCAS